jgi:TRAP-type mannitol/chloroaromatic compound transport system substrate-binding protein
VKIRLYLDEDSMDQELLRALRARGVDLLSALEAGMIERSDREHLDYATSQHRVLCTFNIADFYQLHGEYLQQGKTHAGMILVQQQRFSLGEELRRILKLIASRSAESMQNQAEFLSAWEPR